MKETEVLCIGIACMDVLIKNVDLATPFSEETKHADHVSTGIGGDAANEAIVLSRLGHNVKIMCGIGDDDTGNFIKSTLLKNEVDISDMKEEKGEDSPINVIVIRKDGERNFINAGVAKSAYFVPDFEKIGNPKIVSLASLFLPPFTDVKVFTETAKKAKERGALVSLDVVVSKDSSIDRYKEALPYVDYIFPNREEAEILTGKKELSEMADILLGYGIKNVIIKTGKDGCYIKNVTGEYRIPGYQISNVVDTTGAGDNFAAGLISGLLQKMSLQDACSYACGVAAISIQKQGAIGVVQNREQVNQFITENRR